RQDRAPRRGDGEPELRRPMQKPEEPDRLGRKNGDNPEGPRADRAAAQRHAEAEAQLRQLHEELASIAQAYQRAEGEQRDALAKKFDLVAAELVKQRQKVLEQQAEMLEQHLKRVREDLEQGKDGGAGIIEMLKKHMLERNPDGRQTERKP